jgi:hypothetical protein
VSAYLTRLHSLLGTPGRPVTPVPWDAGREQTGFTFPQDYRQFADEYGSANINRTLGVMCPQQRPAWYSRGSGGGFLDFLEAVIHGTWESSSSVIGRTLTDGPLVEQLGGWADEE